ncbi:sulfotransferase family protein [Leptothoe kymatousa]|uniref:Sulfotransferase n=1 Tax=Leptothoe kymatousa TAU-MAC 1615 TaxID=2364775 RepID=A0ABS5Y5P6_9CYAN|nr:sulfotransferase [Leptothoe kymatousa]MBT9312674.1 sulfotransferase [Leptothoe kymatousa TAU-MAC 1615]
MSQGVTDQQQANRPTPVLMIPIRRCGSHALRLRLNASPDFYSPYPMHIVDFMPLVPAYGDLSNDWNYFQMAVDLVGLQNSTMVKWDGVALDPVSIFNTIKDKPRSVHMVAWEMLFQAGEQNNAKLVMDKSLDNIHYASDLVSLFDDMLFLNVVRDPRAQICSINRAIIHDYDTLLNSLTWVKAHKAAKALADKFPDRVLTIRYEDFLTNQEAVLRKVCQFFKIDFLPTMLDISASPEAQSIAGRSALWENNCFAPIAANIDKFKKALSAEEIEIIETVTKDYMDLYGYSFMTSASANVNDDAIESAKERSALGKHKAWLDLELFDPQDYQLRQFRNDYLGMIKQRLTASQKKKLNGSSVNVQGIQLQKIA